MKAEWKGQPANDTYVLILSHGQWLLWRDTDMVTLTGDPPKAEARGPLAPAS